MGFNPASTVNRFATWEEKIKDIFEYHSPNPLQIEKYAKIRAKALELAEVIIAETPACADQAAAIRLLRESVMTANASIALFGLV